MEIVWPSELYFPYQFDVDSSAVSNIASCLYDDGSIIYDILNGGTSTTFDTDNQIGITAPGGERISATWSGAKPNIDDNPFSLLLTSVEQYLGQALNEFDVGGGSADYADFASFMSAQGNKDNLSLLCTVFNHADILVNNIHSDIYVKAAAPVDFSNVNATPFITKANVSSPDNKNLNIVIDGFKLNAVGINYTDGADIKIKNCFIYTDANASPISNSESISAIKPSLIDSVVHVNNKGYGTRTTLRNMKAYNVLIVGTREGMYAVEATNCIGVDANASSSFNQVSTSNHNIDADLAWFPNIENGNYTISEAGKLAVEGSGWNGSDICEFLYLQTEVTVTYQLEPVHTQQLSVVTTIAVETTTIITAVNSEQINNTSVVDLTRQQSIDVINTQQTSTTTLFDVINLQILGVINTEQVGETSIVDLALIGTNEIALQPSFSEQLSSTTLVTLANTNAIEPIFTQQLSSSTAVSVGTTQHLSVINTEQGAFSTVELLSIENPDTLFSLNASHIRIIRTTPDLTIISTTPIITILES